MIHYLLLFSRQGKVSSINKKIHSSSLYCIKLRLQKWYVAYPDKVHQSPTNSLLIVNKFLKIIQAKKKITRELITTILARKPKMCAFLEYKELKVVYKRSDNIYSLTVGMLKESNC